MTRELIQKLSTLQRFHGDKPDNDVYPDNNDLFRDQRLLLAAWLDPRPIDDEFWLSLFGELKCELKKDIGLRFWPASGEVTLVTKVRLLEYSVTKFTTLPLTTRGSLVRLLHSIGWECPK